MASLFLIAWIGWGWYKRKKLVLHKNLLALSAAVIPAAYLLSIFWAVDKGQALFGFLKTLPIPLFLVALWQISPREKQTLINAIPFIGISMFLLSGAAALLPGVGKNFLVNNRLAGFFQYPNVFAAYLLCGFLIVLQGESKNGKKLLFCLILAAGMLVSGSRTAVFLLAAALLLYLLLKKKPRIFAAALITAAAALGLFWAVFRNSDLFGRYFVLPWQSSTFLGRLLYFRDSLPVILRHPLGLGYNGYYYLQGTFQTGVYSTHHVHNELLQLLLDIGWLPTALVVCAIIQSLRSKSGCKKMVLLFLLAHSMLDFDFQFLAMDFVLLLLMDTQSGTQKSIDPPSRGMACLAGTAAAVFCLWLTAADAAMLAGKPEWTEICYPWHTEALIAHLQQAESVEELDSTADRILHINKSVSLAYSAKAAAAYAEGDCLAMIDCKQQAIALNRYALTEYEDYFSRLWDYMVLYQSQNMTQSAQYCAQCLMEIPSMMQEVESSTSSLGWKIYDKPNLKLPEEYMQRLNLLQGCS
ncbi:MAG: O-antigen ligase family protein [Gemmiger sp.]